MSTSALRPVFESVSRLTKKRFSPRANAWSSTVIALSLGLGACGHGNYDVSNETDRMAMKIDIRNALTTNDCTQAIDLAAKLYQSAYSDNEIRMLYASAHACNVGIRLYNFLDQLSTADLSSDDAIFKAFVRIFPSRTALDTRLQSGWFAQDALQAILKGGSVIGAADAISSIYNPGSVKTSDRTDDANTYLGFVAMSEVGTTLNRYGYNASDDPAALGYAQSVTLPWISEAVIQSDTSGAGCGLASSMTNMIDGLGVAATLASSGVGGAMNSILGILQNALQTFAVNACLAANGSYTNATCAAAYQRLRLRTSCAERGEVAATAAGVVVFINTRWQ